MKFTGQNTVSRGFTKYSRPIEKREIVRIYAYTRISNYDKELFNNTINTITANISDAVLIKEFNKKMNFRIRSFAPGLFQVFWDGQIKMGDGEVRKDK